MISSFMKIHASYSIPVSMIRQFCFCPRIFYFEEVLSLHPEKPLWVDQGVAYHFKEMSLFKRRSLKKFNLSDAIKHYELPMYSELLSIHGKADLLLETDEFIIPVEIKTQTSKPSRGQIYQLCAYGLLGELQFKKKCSKGFFLLKTKDKTFPVSLTEEVKNDVKKVINNIHQVACENILPDTSATTNQCNQCEYINFCNDRNFNY